MSVCGSVSRFCCLAYLKTGDFKKSNRVVLACAAISGGCHNDVAANKGGLDLCYCIMCNKMRILALHSREPKLEVSMEKSPTPVNVDKPNGTGSKSIRSVEIGIRVLDALLESNGPAPLRDIAEAANLSRSQAHRYLASYVNTGLVVPGSLAGYYSLGPHALRLGLAAYSQLDISLVASNAIDELVKATNLTGFVAIWGSHGPTIVRWAHGSPPIATSFGLGSVLSVLSSSAGQAFVAFLPPVVTERLIAKELELMSNSDAVDVPSLREEIRAAGYAKASGSVIPGLSAASAPILNQNGEAAAVLGLIDRDSNHLQINSPAIKQLVKTTAQASADIGFMGES